MTQNHDVVSADLSLLWLSSGDIYEQATVRLCYDPQDPLAVHLDIHLGADEVVTKTFAFELLAVGVIHQTGEGDVRIGPVDFETTGILLKNREESAMFAASCHELEQFINLANDAAARYPQSDPVDSAGIADEASLFLLLQDPDA